ncbi:single myb histone 4 isoform X3 [Magnolia sinica]|uniref:single myb histone 4 isoform X3 n=1 Tax=Magnolia sinica TaxID=86752 RepID=UPI002659BB75|nr:single myb histone 4 isoform X3 [Magnolia sinica]
MGAPKQKWTSEEEEALLAGVNKHGAGKWRTIQKDPEFGHCLAARSNIDLKAKWRNMSVSASGQGSRERSKIPKLKALPGIPSSGAPTQDASPAAVVDPSKSLQDGKVPPRYNTMIIEALSTMQDPSGSEIGAISRFIEQRHEVPPNFRRLLSSKLRRLVGQDKIEKFQNGYKLKESSFATKTPTPKQKDPVHRSRAAQNSGLVNYGETLEEAAMAAAYKIADAEAKSFLACEAVKEAERVARMAEETDSLLQLAKEISEQCSRGEIAIMA